MTTPADHNDRDHALYAPSGAARWLNCTGSIALSEGIESKSSSYAEEGTQCHEAAANILMGLPFDQVCANLSDDQKWIVEEYTNYVFDLIDMLHDRFGNPRIWIEERIRSEIYPNEYHGTGDFAAFAGKTMEIADLKAGFNPVLVRSQNGELNEQLASYAVLALDHHNLWDRVEKVRITIVQPRVYDKPQTTVATIDELTRFYKRVATTIGQIKNGDTEIKPGAHCKYCPARGRCPALREEAATKAKMIFDKPIRLYGPEELEEILNEAELIEAHINGVRAHVARELEKGRTFTNYKLVPKRAMSKWTDPDGVVKTLRDNGFTGPVSNAKILSPAQIKKALKAAKLNIDLSPYYVKESSGVTLARMNDPREATKHDPFEDDA